MILRVFVPDSDSNEEALQQEGAVGDARRAAEDYQEEQVPPRYNEILLFYVYRFHYILILLLADRFR